MNQLQKFMGSAVLALSAALTGLAMTPGTIWAGDHCYYNPKPCYSSPCYSPPCYPKYQQPCCQPSYHYEYHTDYVRVPYTCYDECGHSYTAYTVQAVQTKVKVGD